MAMLRSRDSHKFRSLSFYQKLIVRQLSLDDCQQSSFCPSLQPSCREWTRLVAIHFSGHELRLPWVNRGALPWAMLGACLGLGCAVCSKVVKIAIKTNPNPLPA